MFLRWTLKWMTLQWHHNRCDGVSNQQPHDRLLNHLFRCRSKTKSKLRVAGLCEGDSAVTGELQMASYAEIFPFDDAIMLKSHWAHYTLFIMALRNDNAFRIVGPTTAFISPKTTNSFDKQHRTTSHEFDFVFTHQVVHSLTFVLCKIHSYVLH